MVLLAYLMIALFVVVLILVALGCLLFDFIPFDGEEEDDRA